MTTNDKQDPTTTSVGTRDGAVEIDEANLDQVSGGPAYMKLGDIKGESQIQQVSHLTTRP